MAWEVEGEGLAVQAVRRVYQPRLYRGSVSLGYKEGTGKTGEVDKGDRGTGEWDRDW